MNFCGKQNITIILFQNKTTDVKTIKSKILVKLAITFTFVSMCTLKILNIIIIFLS